MVEEDSEESNKIKDDMEFRKLPLLHEKSDSVYELFVYEKKRKAKALIIPQEDAFEEYIDHNNELAEQIFAEDRKDLSL